jgi:glyoxylase-like metal-dependent hydrolase (beta-lactamase superfamily II)
MIFVKIRELKLDFTGDMIFVKIRVPKLNFTGDGNQPNCKGYWYSSRLKKLDFTCEGIFFKSAS